MEQNRLIIVSTIIDSFNYGTVMQAVATKSILEDYGRPVFVDYQRPWWTPEGHKAEAFSRPGNLLWNRLRYALSLPDWNHRHRLFRTFVEQELTLCDSTPFLTGQGVFDMDAVYCVGSDQTWNASENKGVDPVFFLLNVPDGCRRIALSASFGRQSLSDKEKRMAKPALGKFQAISVRESSSVEILNSMGLDGVALKDPVLLCKPELWWDLSQSVKPDKNPYVLVYRLNPNPALDRYAVDVARDLHCGVRIVTPTLGLRPSPGSSMKIVCEPTPERWLALFRDAQYVVTDSFHGTCFSLIFEKPMTVFDPPKYSVRLIDVLRDFDLSVRRIPMGADPDAGPIHHQDVDWDGVRAAKTRYAGEARAYLDSCLSK